MKETKIQDTIKRVELKTGTFWINIIPVSTREQKIRINFDMGEAEFSTWVSVGEVKELKKAINDILKVEKEFKNATK